MKISRRHFMMTSLAAGAAAAATACAHNRTHSPTTETTPGENGYKLWLRYAPLGPAGTPYAGHLNQIIIEGNSPTTTIIRNELVTATAGLLGKTRATSGQLQQGALIVGTPTTSPTIRALNWNADLATAGPEGYLLRSTRINGHAVTVIASTSERGALYGTFHFIRLLQTLKPIDTLAIADRPRLTLRMANHWDNADGSIERGYAGRSLWNWNELPTTLDPRLLDYARAHASLGINGVVLNNVNADPKFLSPDYLKKVAALAQLWRPYGLRVYLSANFAAPLSLGRLPTTDPLDPAVITWWDEKCTEIYTLIPDFGGFLVKANSEGQPGPQDYHRTHADGANLLANALAPHGGAVIWRAFVYDEKVDADRIKRAYIEFMALDGQFKPNVLSQIKNGPLDFQPREPFHPLFGALQHTPIIAELQPTQEYLGQAKHLVYLGTMWEEFLQSDTHARGKGSTVAKVLQGEVHPARITGMAGVLNPGTDPNWTGHDFSQANWYALGRMAWNPDSSADAIADDWIRMTWSNDSPTVDTIRRMMTGSRETFVNYTMPLGLHHLIGGNHYAPAPENAQAARKDWTAVYYHQATKQSIGFDRTCTGDDAVDQYFPPVADHFNSLDTCPERFLLWFHRLDWTYRLKSGRTLWQELCTHYYQGVREAQALKATWTTLAAKIDPARHQAVAERLTTQAADAAAWRDRILTYFSTINGLPVAPT